MDNENNLQTMDNKIEVMFERLFKLAESVKSGKGDKLVPRNLAWEMETVEDLEIKSDQQMSEMFDKMTKRVEKLITRAREHNKRLPKLVIVEKGILKKKKQIQQEEIDLYQSTRPRRPLNVFAHDVGPGKTERKFKKRGRKATKRESLKAKK